MKQNVFKTEMSHNVLNILIFTSDANKHSVLKPGHTILIVIFTYGALLLWAANKHFLSHVQLVRLPLKHAGNKQYLY